MLLAFVVIGLFGAHIIVKIRHTPTLSDPIELAGSGIAVSQPIHNEWDSAESWHYNTSDNSLTLAARQFQNSARQVEIRWRYLLCSTAESAWDTLTQRLEQAEMVFGKRQTLDGPVSMEYTTILSKNGDDPIKYTGIAQLEMGRLLELQVEPSPLSGIDAEALFLSLAGSIEYTPLPELQAGKALADTLWETLARDTETREDSQAFLIKDAEQTSIGFLHTETAVYRTDAETQIKIDQRQYDTASQIQSSFVMNTSDKSFVWKSLIQILRAKQSWTLTISNDAEGQLIIQPSYDAQRRFSSSCLLVPELLLPNAVQLFLGQAQQRLVIDVLSASGEISPTLLEKINPAEALAHSDDVAQAVKVVFLNHHDSLEQYFFNANEDLIGRLKQQSFKRRPFKRLRLWERSSPEALRKIFPDSFKTAPETVALRTPLECQFNLYCLNERNND